MVSLIGQLTFNGVVMGLIYVILAAGLVLIMNVSKIFLIAYGQFYMIGGYIVWAGMTIWHLPFGISLVAAVLATAILGLLSYCLIFQHIQFAKNQFLVVIVGAIGLMMLLAQGGLIIFGSTARGVPSAFPGVTTFAGISFPNDKLALVGLALTITLVLFWVYEKTNLGRVMRAVAFSPDAASLQGISIQKIYLIILGVGSAIAGFAGAIMAPSYSLSPDMGTNIFLPVMLIMMLGGMDSLLGTIPSGLIMGMTLSFGQYYIHSASQVILYAIVGIIIFLRPNGLLGRGVNLGI